MPRFLPPHLMVLVALLLIVVWFMLLHQFRRSSTLQRLVAEAFGDETPANTLRNFKAARQRLFDHLNSETLDHQMRQQIELALGEPRSEHAIESRQETHVS